MATPTQSVPRIGGFIPISAHDCTRCGALARVMYAAIPGDPPEREGKHMDSYREYRTPDGAFAKLVGWNHHEEQTAYYYYNWRAKPCGYVLPLPADDKPEQFIQQIYGMFFSYPHKPLERIVRFDVDAFLSSPLVIRAEARDIGPLEMRQPIIMLAGKNMLRYIMATGKVPVSGTDIQALGNAVDAATAAKAAQDFLGLIKAETLRIRV